MFEDLQSQNKLAHYLVVLVLTTVARPLRDVFYLCVFTLLLYAVFKVRNKFRRTVGGLK